MQKNIFKFKEFILVDILMLIEFTNNDLVEQLCNLVTSKFLKIKKGNCYVYILFKNRQIPQKSTS